MATFGTKNVHSAVDFSAEESESYFAGQISKFSLFNKILMRILITKFYQSSRTLGLHTTNYLPDFTFFDWVHF